MIAKGKPDSLLVRVDKLDMSSSSYTMHLPRANAPMQVERQEKTEQGRARGSQKGWQILEREKNVRSVTVIIFNVEIPP